MEHRNEARDDDPIGQPAAGPLKEAAYDRRWARDLFDSVRCAAVLLGLLFLIDRGAGSLTHGRAALWLTLAVLLFVVLCPARVSAGEGWLASRRLLRTRRVRTDLLVSVRRLDGVAQRLVLRDVFGHRVEIDPEVLVGNPDLWHRLSEDAHTSLSRGTLTCGATVLRRVAERIDRENATPVFTVSGLR
ncbi:hypothetical protein ABT121_27955 [Streptomyces sp. NPDC001928]|uniref:hypothetical protein n=1 Tax=Streptomyces sp. NPDC001928 TaxID=3154404 RepID=UPI00332DCD3F